MYACYLMSFAIWYAIHNFCAIKKLITLKEKLNISLYIMGFLFFVALYTFPFLFSDLLTLYICSRAC